ncbi:MAG: DUF494 family protein [bacterium]
MFSRIMEIVVLLMDEFGRKNLQVNHFDLISQDLLKNGYTESEINTAFSWLYRHLEQEAGDVAALQWIEVSESSKGAHRMLSAFERQYFTEEALSFLLQMKYLEFINAKELEILIERVQLTDSPPISLEEIKMLVIEVLYEQVLTGKEQPRRINPPLRKGLVH